MKERKLKLITEIIAIVVICLISFVGIYKEQANKMKNQVKSYDFGKDLSGYRELVFKVSDATEVLDSSGKVVGNTDSYTDSAIESNSYQKTENKINAEQDLTEENYEKAKSIIQTRLKTLNVEDYNISVNKENGTIYLQLPENSETDHTVSNILQVAKFEIKDSEDTSKVFLTNDDVKKVSTVYNTTSSGTTVYLEFRFNKTGKNVLGEISEGDYATKENTTSNSTENTNSTDENNTNENNTNENTNTENSENSDENTDSEDTSKNETQKKIILSVDNNDMITTSFDTKIEDGVIDLSMNKATTDQDSISDSLQSASTIAAVINSGKMPLTYKIAENNYINSDITKTDLSKVIYFVIIVSVIALAILVIKYKLRGLIASIAFVGFAGLYLLLVRYTNVTVTLESICALAIVLAINYLITYKLLSIKETDNEIKSKLYVKEFKAIMVKSIPIFIIAVVFAFIKWTKISTFGMFIFWGLLLSLIYNYVITRDMLD